MFKKATKPAPAKKARRAKGTGSIRRDKRRGGYVWRIPVGRYPNNTTRYVEVRGETQAECVEKGKLVQPPDPNAVTVAEWAARWITGLSNRSSTKTVYAHSVTSRVVPDLGHFRLRELTVSRVKEAAAKWVGSKKDGKLAPQTVNLTLDRAATMFAAAIVDRLATENPFALCPRFEFERKDIDPHTREELAVIIRERARYSCGPLFAFLAGTGCRVGEAVALDVSDYDREAATVRITKTHNPDHGTGPPKSKYSRRTIDLTPGVCAAIEEAIGERAKGVLFATAAGRRFHYSQLRTRFTALQKALGMRPRNLHSLRHGVATAQVAAGVPLGDVAKHLGDTVEMIVKTYLHETKHDMRAAMRAILGE